MIFTIHFGVFPPIFENTYHIIISLTTNLEAPHGATTKVARVPTGHATIASRPFFSCLHGPGKDGHRSHLDVSPDLPDEVETDVVKNLGDFSMKKHTVFVDPRFQDSLVSLFLGEIPPKKSGTFCKDNLEIGPHPLKRREFMLMNLNGFLAN